MDDENEIEDIEMPTAGWDAARTPLYVNVGRHRCGNITGGVAMHFGERGVFIVPWADFKRAYEANAKLRGEL